MLRDSEFVNWAKNTPVTHKPCAGCRRGAPPELGDG